MNHIDTIMNARVIIAIAGMEGALASVIGGMADCPVIAVPTSVGYGAITGQSAIPPMTLASAPSIPAIAIITLAFIIVSIWFISLCIPATPTSYSLTTSLPYTSAVLAA